jgi:hypothetical protein
MRNFNLKTNVQNLSTEISKLIDQKSINDFARETKFISRDSKMDGNMFLDILLFTHFNHKELSLNNLAIQIKKRFNVDISKQAIDERFTEKAVKFLKLVLVKTLEIAISRPDKIDFTKYDKVLIKDATSFQLPSNMIGKYKGSGGSASPSMIKIQFEYDLKSGIITDLSLHAFVDQDSTNAKNTVENIKPNELIIRDLGYISIPVLKTIQEKEAYYLNRLHATTNVYQKINNKLVKVDFAGIHKYMKDTHLQLMEIDVYMGKKELFKTRLIIGIVPTKSYQERIRKATSQAKKDKRTMTDEYKDKLALNLFTTNTDIPLEDIRPLYTLRWQIELMFKIWKSIGEIDEVKKMKVERFESFLIAKLIWLVLNWHIVKLIVHYFYKKERIGISPFKLYVTLKEGIMDFRAAIRKSINSISSFIMENINLGTTKLFSEKKKNSKTWSYDIYESLQITY